MACTVHDCKITQWCGITGSGWFVMITYRLFIHRVSVRSAMRLCTCMHKSLTDEPTIVFFPPSSSTHILAHSENTSSNWKYLRKYLHCNLDCPDPFVHWLIPANQIGEMVWPWITEVHVPTSVCIILVGHHPNTEPISSMAVQITHSLTPWPPSKYSAVQVLYNIHSAYSYIYLSTLKQTVVTSVVMLVATIYLIPIINLQTIQLYWGSVLSRCASASIVR